MDNNGLPLISVVVPVYGVELYLDQCVQSIVSQSYRNLEIILVDDGSKDKCPEMVDSWSDKDKRIKVLHKINGGLSSARNEGLKIATGKYVTFVDSDDWLETSFVERLYTAANLYNADIAVGGFQRVYENKIVKSKFLIDSENLYYPCVPNQAIKYFFEIAIAVWGKLYRLDKVADILFIEGRLAEDIPYQMEVLKRTNVVAFCNKHLYDYRIRDNSIAHTIKPKYLVDHIKSVSEAYDACKQNFIFEEKFCKSWLSSLIYEFLAAKDFGKIEKIEAKEQLEYALYQVGGNEKLINNIETPLAIIFYTYSQFHQHLTKPERKKLQRDYRSKFSIGMMKQYGKQFFKKYIPAYISLEFAYKLSKLV